MWGTPHGSRRTVTGCSRPASFRVPSVRERAERARCSRDCLPAEERRDAAARGARPAECITRYGRLRAAKRLSAIFRKGQWFIAGESPLYCAAMLADIGAGLQESGPGASNDARLA